MTFPIKKKNFKRSVRDGDAEIHDVDDWIEAWHFPQDADEMSEEMIDFAENSEMHEFLGLTEEQYGRFVTLADEEGNAVSIESIFEDG